MSDYSNQIASVPLLSTLSEGLRESVSQIFSSIGTECMLTKDETLYREGEEGDNTGVVLVSGSVEVSHGDSVPIVVDAPELFGEMQQMNESGQRVATIRADEPSVVLQFSWHDFVSRVIGSSDVSNDDRKELQRALNQYGTVRVQDLFDLER